ncbi:hypothetical protein [Pseudomonas sp. OTU5201]|uniref:hypothetical protein n=1 Tax=Pseudomonas sp. OTU5201 TaxID=3043850 RepID=UPI00313B170F
MSRSASFPALSDFSEQVQEVSASSPPGAFRQLGNYQLVQASAAVDSLLDALMPGEPGGRRAIPAAAATSVA